MQPLTLVYSVIFTIIFPFMPKNRKKDESHKLTRIALNTVAESPSATSYSPLSLGRVKLLSNDDVNILKKKNKIKELNISLSSV